jgi:hypothetical protein
VGAAAAAGGTITTARLRRAVTELEARCRARNIDGLHSLLADIRRALAASKVRFPFARPSVTRCCLSMT